MNVNVVKNFKTLDVDTQILFLILLKADDNGATRLKKSDFANYLKISEQTVGKHLKKFADCNMIKYKYSGLIRINPDFYYKGLQERIGAVKTAYATFRSDM